MNQTTIADASESFSTESTPLRTMPAPVILRSMSYDLSNNTRLAGCGIMLLLFGVLPISYLAGGAYTEAFPRPFNSESWIAGEEIADNRRCGMLTDLKLRVGIEGKTRRDVIALLGEPQDRRYEPSMSYWLLCPSFMDIWVLGVRWENGRAVQAIVHDT